MNKTEEKKQSSNYGIISDMNNAVNTCLKLVKTGKTLRGEVNDNLIFLTSLLSQL